MGMRSVAPFHELRTERMPTCSGLTSSTNSRPSTSPKPPPEQSLGGVCKWRDLTIALKNLRLFRLLPNDLNAQVTSNGLVMRVDWLWHNSCLMPSNALLAFFRPTHRAANNNENNNKTTN